MKLILSKLILSWVVTAGFVAGIWYVMSPIITGILAAPDPGLFNAYLPALISMLATILMMVNAPTLGAAICMGNAVPPREDD